MKRISLTLCLSALVCSPLYAETLCQEQAEAIGYVGPAETLKPCTPKNKKTSQQAYSDQVAKGRAAQDMPQSQDPQPRELYGQMQIQE
mgnify:CR=1 FL=1